MIDSYRFYRRLLEGQIHKGSHLGRLLSREKEKNNKLLRMLNTFDERIIQQVEDLRKKFQMTTLKAQRLSQVPPTSFRK